MSIQPKDSTSPKYSAEDVRGLANIGYAHGTSVSFVELPDIVKFFERLTQGSESFDVAFSATCLKNVPSVCLNYAASLPAISLFQQLFYTAVYDTGSKKRDLHSHQLSMECQQLIGEILLDEDEPKVVVKDLTHRLLNRLDPKNANWIGSLSNFFAACEKLLTREHLSVLKTKTSELVEVDSPSSLPKVCALIVNKAKLNLLTLQMASNQLKDCFDIVKCSLSEAIILLKKHRETALEANDSISSELKNIKQIQIDWSIALFRAYMLFQRKLNRIIRSDQFLLLFNDATDAILNDNEKGYALFIKNNWQAIESLQKRFSQLEKEAFSELTNALEHLTLLRYLDQYLIENPNQNQKCSAEQLSFELRHAYSKLVAYPDPNRCWKIAANLKASVKSSESLKVSLCLFEVHKHLSRMRPILKATSAVTNLEFTSLFAQKNLLVEEIEKRLDTAFLLKQLLPLRKISSKTTIIVESSDSLQTVKNEEREEELLVSEAPASKSLSYQDSLLLIVEECRERIRNISLTVPSEKRKLLENASMKLALLTTELLSASKGIYADQLPYHRSTVAKYIHGVLQELLTAFLEDQSLREHSLVALAAHAKIEIFGDLFRRYDRAGAAARRPLERLKLSTHEDFFHTVNAVRVLLDLFFPSPKEKEFINKFLEQDLPLLTSKKNPSILFEEVQNLILKARVEPNSKARQCFEHAVWNLEMLAYRLDHIKEVSAAGIDLLTNECCDLFHTVVELVVRAKLIQTGIYQHEGEAQTELGHSLEAQLKKTTVSFELWEDELKQFIKEYDQVSFTRFAAQNVDSLAAAMAKKTRQTANIQRRIMGLRGYDELHQIWEQIELEHSYCNSFNYEDAPGFVVKLLRSTKRVLKTHQEALAKIHKDVALLVKFLGEINSENGMDSCVS